MTRWNGLRWAVVVAVVLVLVPRTGWAGGWSLITLDGLPQELRAGTPFALGFVVRQHGTRLMEGLEPQVMLRHADMKQPLLVKALPVGEVGHYVANVSLPQAGTWQLAIEAFGAPTTFSPLVVGEAAAVASAVAAPVGQPWPRFGLIAAGTAGLLVISAGLAYSYHRRQQVAAR